MRLLRSWRCRCRCRCQKVTLGVSAAHLKKQNVSTVKLLTIITSKYLLFFEKILKKSVLACLLVAVCLLHVHMPPQERKAGGSLTASRKSLVPSK